MRMTKTICTVNPILWEGYLLLSFDSKWIEVFGFVPSFEVVIEKERLVLLGPKIPVGRKK